MNYRTCCFQESLICIFCSLVRVPNYCIKNTGDSSFLPLIWLHTWIWRMWVCYAIYFIWTLDFCRQFNYSTLLLPSSIFCHSSDIVINEKKMRACRYLPRWKFHLFLTNWERIWLLIFQLWNTKKQNIKYKRIYTKNLFKSHVEFLS